MKGAFYAATHLIQDDLAPEISGAVDAVEGRNTTIKNDGNIGDGGLVGLRIIAAVDEKALIFIAEVIAKDAFYACTFLFDNELCEIVVVHSGQIDIGVTIPGTGDTLSGEPGGYD